MKVGEFLNGLDREAPVVTSGRVIYCPECHDRLTEAQAFVPLWQTPKGARRELTKFARAATGKRTGELTLRHGVGRGGPIITACCLRHPMVGVWIVSGSQETWEGRMP